MKLLGLALFFSRDKTRSCLSFGSLVKSPGCHTSPRPVLSVLTCPHDLSPPPTPVESKGPACCTTGCECCQPKDRCLSVFRVRAVSDTPSLLRPPALPATWLPQSCHLTHTRTPRAWLETVFLFSATDAKPNGFHHVCYCVTSILSRWKTPQNLDAGFRGGVGR